jgi:hypothetical protein
VGAAFLVMKTNTSQKVVIGILLLTGILRGEIRLRREWKGYFLLLMYVGGLLIMVLYLSSFRVLNSSSLVLILVFLFLFLREDKGIYSSKGVGSVLWSQPSFVLFSGLGLIGLMCFLVRQFLLRGASLRLL